MWRKRRRKAKRIEKLCSSSSDEEEIDSECDCIEEELKMVIQNVPELFFERDEANLSQIDKKRI